MSEAEFVNIVNDFFFHNIWACKKLKRGELWSAKMCIDGYLKERLLKIVEQYHIAAGIDVWHDGRFIDRWAEPSVLNELKACFAHYEPADCRNALMATHTLFSRLAAGVARRRGFVYPAEAEKCAAEYLGKVS
jgi:aminoglycoside 6-adenylyltransferase